MLEMMSSSHYSSCSFLLIAFSLLLICEAQNRGLLPEEEKNALREIGEELGKSDWDFDVNPCDESTSWSTPGTDALSVYVSNVTCNCDTPDGYCHVQSILLKGQDLAGVLPPSLAKLPNLTIIDLSCNYLSGTIPPEWTSMKLETMSLMLNQLSGPIPKYLGNMTSLVYMRLESNMFNGTVPKELGGMVNLQILILSFNNLTGQLPEELNKLTNLKELRLRGNNFTGKLPNLESFKTLQRLRITDLTGGASEFPQLGNMTRLTRLILRNCNLSGKIPPYITKMPKLKLLDLSFNKFEGQIPNLESLKKLDFFMIDLSYNNFSESSEPICQETLNLFRSYNGTKNSEFGKCVPRCSKNFKPPPDYKKLVPIIAGSVVSLLILILTISFVAWKRHRNKIAKEEESRGLDSMTGVFTIRQIKVATNNFDAANKIGEGGFGSVYKGTLSDGAVIAVKQLSSKSKQGKREFVNEIGMISSLHHPNLVQLYGCCAERNHLLLVYEYMENNSLARALFGPEEHRLKIDWPTRQKICIGIAKGLSFLHEESSLKIVHRDIKATNVLLDKKLNPKISDFGLARLDDDDNNTHITTRVAGTIGYMAPEYALWGYLTYKADVYSFGVLALEIAAGKSNMTYRPNEKFVCLLDWALVLQRQGKLKEVVDATLGSDLNEDEALRMLNVALLCTSPSPALRPTMSAVVKILENHLDLPEFTMESRFYDDYDLFNFQGLRDKYEDTNESQPLTHSSNTITTRDCSYTTSTSA